MKNRVYSELCSVPTHSRTVRGFCLLLLFASFGFVVGCGSGGKPNEAGQNSVTGKVLFGDKPVSGNVVFLYADGKELTGPIGPDGSYQIPDPTPGQVKVYLKSSGIGAPVVPKGSPEMPKDGPTTGGGVPPPQKYLSANTSGLTYEVKPGKHTWDIPVK